MVSNRNFSEMVSELNSDEQFKMDYLVPSSRLQMQGDGAMSFNDNEFQMREVAHLQVANKLKIPKQFYDRMGDHEGLRTTVVNRLMPEYGKTSMVRTTDGDMRAFLSDRYKPIENLDVLNAAAPVLRDMHVEVKASSLTEKRMYLQVAFPKLEAEIQLNDVVQFGLTITNSEVGFGMVKVSPTIWRLVCTNGMIRSAEINHRHIGKQQEMGEDYSVFSDEAKVADKVAFALKLRDTIQATVSEASFEAWVSQMKGAVNDRINDVVKTVANVSKNYGISEDLNDFMINNIAEEGNLSRWGVANAVTNLAHHTDSRDLQYEVEQIGSKIIDMSAAQWTRIAA